MAFERIASKEKRTGMNNDALIKDCIKRLSNDELNEIIDELGQPTHDLDSPLRKLVKTIYGENVGVYLLRVTELIYPLLKETQKRWQRPPISQDEFERLIDENMVEFIGESKWVKDSAYQVYKYGERYFIWVVYDSLSKFVLEDILCEIKCQKISEIIWKIGNKFIPLSYLIKNSYEDSTLTYPSRKRTYRRSIGALGK